MVTKTKSKGTFPEKNFMRQAIILAVAAFKRGDNPVGAILVLDGNVVGEGSARDITTGDCTAHAEMEAIRDAQKKGISDLGKCILFTTLEPCLMCSGAIFHAKLKTVFAGASRHHLPKHLRPKKLRMHHLGDDVSYEITLKVGILKNEIRALYEKIKK